jgi:nitrite reductase/ring-hydroxylating ferredoxin subunit
MVRPPAPAQAVALGSRTIREYQVVFNGICRTACVRTRTIRLATLWDNLIDCPYHHFMYNVQTGENYFPKNVYPKDYPKLQEQVRPLRTYPVELRDSEVWVDLG